MHYRALGKTGMTVSEVSLGGNRLGQDYATKEHWVNLVHKAIDLGVNLIDTAESYGWGRSEEMIGLAVGNRDDVFIASKVCRVKESGDQDWSADRIIERCEGSLKRLKRDVIDVFQLHSPRRETLVRDNWLEGMARLKAQGKIRAAAVAVSTADDAVWLMENDMVDVMQITYSIFVTDVEEKVLPMAQDKGVGLLCRMPLARGVLTGKFSPGQHVADGHRALLDGDTIFENIQRAEALRPIAAKLEGGMTRMALQFSLSSLAISAIIPGARTVEQLTENVAASNGTGLSEDVLAQIAAVQQTWMS